MAVRAMRATGNEIDEKWSQASLREYRYWTDQHGREWGSDIEKSTGHPCGPLIPNGWDAPLLPPSKYIMIVDARRGIIEIDYDLWIEQERDAHEAWEQEALQAAVDLYGDKGEQMLKERDPGIYRRVGAPPLPVERVLAAKAGNRWVLGLKDAQERAPKKPAWAGRFFPEPQPTREAPEDLAKLFPDADEEDAPDEPDVYPKMYGPGLWYLTRAHWAACIAGTEKGFRGSRDEAEQAAGLRDDVDPSWE